MLNIISNTCIQYRPKIDADKDWMELYRTNAKGCDTFPARYVSNEHL
jgi:hypothetical protein